MANLFMPCGKIVDCRLCCDPNSALRFAFIEFDSEAAVSPVTDTRLVARRDAACCSDLDTKCNSMFRGTTGSADQWHAAGQWHCACDSLSHRDESGQAGVPATLGQMSGSWRHNVMHAAPMCM